MASAGNLTLVYGFDPLCGWCYGLVPALERLAGERPRVGVELVLGGLVTGERIRPARESAGYIAQASARMTAATGQRLAPAFFERIIGSQTILASSIPPSAAIAQVRAVYPDAALAFAHRVQRAHFEAGEDLNDPATYPPLLAELGLDIAIDLPDPRDPPPALAAEFAAVRALGITSFPTIGVRAGNGAGLAILPTVYEPAGFVAQVDALLLEQGRAPGGQG